MSTEKKMESKPKKLSDLAKVKLLEETLCKGTLEELCFVLKNYQPFEMTARALLIAVRYRGAEFVKALLEANSAFHYENTPALQKKYKMQQTTAIGTYRTLYELSIAPEKLCNRDIYSPFCGIAYIDITEEQEKNVLSVSERIDSVKLCLESGALTQNSLGEMLFFALLDHAIDFADALIALGANLKNAVPSYYIGSGERQTYLEIITTGQNSVYWNAYTSSLCRLKERELLPVLERFSTLAAKEGGKLIISQKMADSLQWSEASLNFVLKKTDISKINQKKLMETAVIGGFVSSLEIMSEFGWLENSSKREALMEFARESNYVVSLAWMMDFKNRTVDIQAESDKKEAKMIKELTADPNSVAVLKKLWSFQKAEDGTIIITGYKGEETEVTIPSMIGKAKVTAIGEAAFDASMVNLRNRYQETRSKIKKVTIPEGIIEIRKNVFWSCRALEEIVIPSTVKRIETPLANHCPKLEKAILPEGVEIVGNSPLFVRCLCVKT